MKTRLEAQDANYEARIRESFVKQRIMELLGARLTTVQPGLVEIEMPTRDDLTQQDGFVHAGVVTTLLDSACGYAAYTLMPADSSVLSVEFKVNLLSPATGQLITAHAEVKRAGKTLTVCTADAVTDRGVCATMLATMICRQSNKV